MYIKTKICSSFNKTVQIIAFGAVLLAAECAVSNACNSPSMAPSEIGRTKNLTAQSRTLSTHSTEVIKHTNRSTQMSS